MIQSMRMFAVDFGDFYGTQLDGIRRNPSPTETQREMLRSEPVYRDALARLERGEVIAAPHPRREYTDATLQEKLYYDTLSVSNETYRQMSDRCHDAPYTAAGFNRCLAGHYEGRMHHADPDAPKEACRVDISQEGRVSVHANGRQFAPFQIKYRAAGVDYAPSGDIRLARLYGFTGWRKVEALDPLDVVLGLRRETLMVDMTGVGSTREIQMRLEVAGETQPDGIPVYATCMITSRR